MAKGTPLTDTERQTIADRLRNGDSRTVIARETDRSIGTIAAIAKEIGWTGDQSAALHARAANKARSAFCAERRAESGARAQVEIDRLFEELHEPHLVFNFGGKDNTYAEHVLDEPPTDAKFTMVKAISTLNRMILDIDRHDNAGGGELSMVEEWIRVVSQGPAE